MWDIDILSISTGFLRSRAASSEGSFRETFTVLCPRLDPSALQNVQTDAAMQFYLGCSSSPISLLLSSLLKLSITVSLKPNVRLFMTLSLHLSGLLKLLFLYVCIRKSIMALWRYLQKESNQENWYLHGDRVLGTAITEWVAWLSPATVKEGVGHVCIAV